MQLTEQLTEVEETIHYSDAGSFKAKAIVASADITKRILQADSFSEKLKGTSRPGKFTKGKKI